MPINLSHLILLLLHLFFFAYPFGLLLFIPGKASHCLVHNLLAAIETSLQLLNLFLVGHEALGVCIHQRSEVAKKSMSWLQEVKLWISAFSLSQPHQEFLAIPCHELGCQLDDVGIHRGNVRVVHKVLLRRRWLHVLFLLLTHGQSFELLLLFLLLILLGLLINDGLWNFWLCLLDFSSLELLHLVIIVRPVRVIWKQERKLRVVLLSQHTLLEPLSALGYELSSLVDHAADVWWGVD
mmetsp:Transcript_55071/g.98243  ORF Transcript_55071/g.98243 Transcript_55071/m.98243 type:complete len:238 (+) Transcript_55071:1478-2191(+)